MPTLNVEWVYILAVSHPVLSLEAQLAELRMLAERSELNIDEFVEKRSGGL
jgi:hypothetical protein